MKLPARPLLLSFVMFLPVSANACADCNAGDVFSCAAAAKAADAYSCDAAGQSHPCLQLIFSAISYTLVFQGLSACNKKQYVAIIAPNALARNFLLVYY
jgi:hypothetical protein